LQQAKDLMATITSQNRELRDLVFALQARLAVVERWKNDVETPLRRVVTGHD
jgi:hypothetical protein